MTPAKATDDSTPAEVVPIDPKPSVYDEGFDASKVAADVLAQRATEHDLDAFKKRIEAERVATIASLATEAERPTFEQLVSETAAAADKAERVARRSAGAEGVKLDDEALAKARTEFLTNYRAQLQGEHAAHSALIADSERQLAITGDDALDEFEVEAAQKQINDSTVALKVLESALALVREKQA